MLSPPNSPILPIFKYNRVHQLRTVFSLKTLIQKLVYLLTTRHFTLPKILKIHPKPKKKTKIHLLSPLPLPWAILDCLVPPFSSISVISSAKMIQPTLASRWDWTLQTISTSLCGGCIETRWGTNSLGKSPRTGNIWNSNKVELRSIEHYYYYYFFKYGFRWSGFHYLYMLTL